MNTFSIIIPVKPGGHLAACDHLQKIIPDDPRYEIILAEGSAPSRQRNLAAKEAVGDILYFLDDDSLISPENLDECINCMVDPLVAVVGGPSLTPSDDNRLQQLFGYVLSSSFGSGAVANRYRVRGKTRQTTDKELILCNLAVRRPVFSDTGGFNESLYPNEENEFLERVASAGYTLIHSPAMHVFRSQRHTLKAFVRQMFNYGRGRAQQSLITGRYPVTSFIPLIFLAYLIISLIYVKYVLLLLPLVLYMSMAFVSSFLVFRQTGCSDTLLMPAVYLLMHITNGLGLLWGLINGKPEPVRVGSICVKKIKLLGESFPARQPG